MNICGRTGENDMRAKAFLAASALALASCGTAPTTRLEYAADATDVVINIRCQLREASERVAFLREGYGWSALAVLNLTMVNNASIGGGPSLSTPLGRKVLGLGAGVGYGGRASSTVNFGFAQDLSRPEAIPCEDKGDRQRPRLQGDLKIVDWLLSFEKTMTAAEISTPAMSHEISFSVTRSASGDASLIAIPVGGSLLSVGGDVAGSATDEHTLILSYTRNPPPEKKGGGGGGGKGGGGGGGSHVSPPNDNRLEDLIILDLLRDKNRVRIPQ
jgi:hypothetical protein